MEELIVYFKLGLEHVLDWMAYDHVLFIAAMSTLYIEVRKREAGTIPLWQISKHIQWRWLLLLVTAFTLGHTISLFLSNYQLVAPPSKWIEFLIPVTIIITGVFNVFKTYRTSSKQKTTIVFVLTLIFGLIHGFGFGKYFNLINDDQELMPLFGFAIGIEVAQLIVVVLVALLGYILQMLLNLKYKIWVLIISLIIIALTLPMLIENFPH